MDKKEANTSCSDTVELKILGEFDLKINGNSLVASLGHSFKLRSILCYLMLARGRFVPRAELIDVFYEDEKQLNPEGALKMQIMRIKKALAQFLGDVQPIISKRGSYRWNPEITCCIDSEVFERYCDIGNDIRLTNEERINAYRKAIELYDGDVVLDNDGMIWSKTFASVLHTKFLGTTGRFVVLLNEAELDPEIENVSLKAIGLDPYNEEMYILLMQALINQQKYSEARLHYKVIAEALFKDLGINPSDTLQELYAQSCTDKKPWEQDLMMILEDMRDTSNKQGAFFCGYEQFKSIYRLEVRRAKRNGTCLHVALLTVTGNEQKLIDNKVLDAVMDKVQTTVLIHLRQSDVVAKYSNQQFLIMLPYANREDSYQVMERVVRAYKVRYPTQKLQLSYQIRELELPA